MVQWVKIGGRERPISFGYEVGYAYEMATGGNYNELIMQIAAEITAAGQAMSDNDLNRVAVAMRVRPLTDVVYHGLKYAHRREQIEIDFEPEDVAGWLFRDQAAIQACVSALFESLPRPGESDDESAKKKTVTSRSASTGKGYSQRQRL